MHIEGESKWQVYQRAKAAGPVAEAEMDLTRLRVLAAVARDEDVDVVGLSILSGAHMTLFPRVRKLLTEQGRQDILVTGGGIIPDDDAQSLERQGIGKLFGPGTSITASHVGVLASIGQARVRVHRRPCVVVVSSGDELTTVEDGAIVGQQDLHRRPLL